MLSFPVVALIVFLVLAALAGVLAAIRPARRASRLDVLEALAYGGVPPRRGSGEAPRPMAAPGRTAADLAERLLAGDKRALARAISLVENDDPRGWALVREVYPRTGRAAVVVGFTGPPGVGKSTLIGRLDGAGARARAPGGRALDRPELALHPGRPARRPDPARRPLPRPGVYIRSMASRGSLGGLSEATLQAALLMDASGKDDVFLETVGVGQAEVDIIDHADTVVLVLMPGIGRLDPGAQGGRDGDPRRDRGQQVGPPAHRHDGARDPRRALARAPGGLAGADREDRGEPRRGAWRSWPRRSPSTARSSRSRARSPSAGGATS